jgi:hypothetical protein
VNKNVNVRLAFGSHAEYGTIAVMKKKLSVNSDRSLRKAQPSKPADSRLMVRLNAASKSNA